jgi:hemerythrin-like domain-containing protein
MEPAESAISILKAEHEVILRVLDHAEQVTRLLLRGDAVPSETLFDLVQFFYQFVDRKHRHKEEDLLFPMLEEKGVLSEAIETDVLDHEEGSWWIGSMRQLAQAHRHQCGEAGRRWAETAANYIQVLRAHIDSENRRLFPAIERNLSASELRVLAAAFAAQDTEEPGGLVERCLAADDPAVLAAGNCG